MLPLLATLLCSSGVVQADPLATVQSLRRSGCDGAAPVAQPLRRTAQLDRAAQLWAGGVALGKAVDRSGYAAQNTTARHVSGPEHAVDQTLRRSNCRSLLDAGLRDVGMHVRGQESWLVLAAPYATPSKAQAPQIAERVIELTNAARARGTRCGSRSFEPTAPLRLSRTLSEVAAGHALDMAEHDYLEHRDRAGRSPAERVRALGYRDRVVGENIAYGPTSAEEVVQGWLRSPGHCTNIMDSRFTEMGIAYAPARSTRHELYWVQMLALPARKP